MKISSKLEVIQGFTQIFCQVGKRLVTWYAFKVQDLTEELVDQHGLQQRPVYIAIKYDVKVRKA
jgi:hypothetical protein